LLTDSYDKQLKRRYDANAYRRLRMKRAAIYVRVSTDKQTIDNHLRELRQIAARRGWEVVHEHHDAGISGAKSREARPEWAPLRSALWRPACAVCDSAAGAGALAAHAIHPGVCS
jgi:Resolvase, N terminal domain